MTTYLAFDFGMKRVGVAVGQTVTKTASALTTLHAKDGIPKWGEIEKLVSKWEPVGIVVGIPLNMDGSEQLLTLCARKFGNRIKEKFKLPVYEVDERLSTWEVKDRFGKDPEHVDAHAAAVILEQWFSESLGTVF